MHCSRCDVAKDGSLGVASQGSLQDTSELRVAVGNMRTEKREKERSVNSMCGCKKSTWTTQSKPVAFREFADDVAERQQALVDQSSFAQTNALSTSLRDTLTASQVDKMLGVEIDMANQQRETKNEEIRELTNVDQRTELVSSMSELQRLSIVCVEKRNDIVRGREREVD